jgi:uncharacterized protein YbjT (DUF2867 family)
VVAALKTRGATVRTLVRDGSQSLEGVEVVRGDMLQPQTLGPAFAGVDVAVCCAAGYTKRRKTDTTDIDVVGNENLAEAAKNAGLRRYVLCSILQCDQTRDVTHFVAKANAEAALRERKVPFVALRPGGFLDQTQDYTAKNAMKGRYMGFGDKTKTRLSYVYTADLAQSLATAALTDKPVEGRTIDVGWSTGPVSNQELADTIAAQTNRKIKVSVIPWWVLRFVKATIGLFRPAVRDLINMFLFFETGKYVVGTRVHEELLGPLPSKDDAVRRWARTKGLV